MRLLIKNGDIVDVRKDRLLRGDVLIGDDGRIIYAGLPMDAGIDEAGECRVINAEGLTVFPGLIDIHVHLREPGFEYKESIKTGLAAAAAGGFTAVACMPNTNPVIDNGVGVRYIKSSWEKYGLSRLYPIGAITKGQLGQELAEIGDMAGAGAVAVSDDGKSVMNTGLLRRAMDYVKAFNIPVISHCEDEMLAGEGVMNEGEWSTRLGLKGIPSQAEEIIVARDIMLAELTGCRLHIAHVSTAGSVRLIRRAKEDGIDITCETAPHYFTLTEEAVASYDTNTKINPPLRSGYDREAIMEGLRDGTIDLIASDHAPHSNEDKDVEYDYAPFGIIGLETSLSLSVDRLIGGGVIGIPGLARKMSTNPAKVIGLEMRGEIEPGFFGDITIVDLNSKCRIDTESMRSKARNTPFDGFELRGEVVATIVGGRVIYESESLLRE